MEVTMSDLRPVFTIAPCLKCLVMLALLTFFSVSRICLSEVVFVAEVARHGARVPAQMFPWDKKSKQWTYGKDELTPLGMRQHYLLGAELRQRYIVEQQVLSENYNASEVYVIASDLDRTIDSAQSQLHGLFPAGPQVESSAVPPIAVDNLTAIEAELGDAALPYQAQVFPVQVTPMLEDFVLRPKYSCAKIVNWTAEIGVSQKYNQTASSNPWVVQTLQTQLPDVDVINQFININNNLKCNLFEGLLLPSAFTPAFLSNITTVFNSVFSLFYEDDSIARLYSSALLLELNARFQALAAGTEQSRFRLYMTNEETLAALLAGMQVFDLRQPQFASSILFEVDSALTVRVIYNDNPLLIPTCPAVDCPLETLIAYIDSRAFPDYETLCNSPTWDEEVESYSSVVSRALKQASGRIV